MHTALSAKPGPSVRTSVAQLQANAVRAAKFLKSMANPARLMVLCQLSIGESSVGELERIVGISQSGLSQHLAVLRREGIVKTRRVGQTILYSLAGREAALVMDVLYDMFCRKAAGKPAREPKQLKQVG